MADPAFFLASDLVLGTLFSSENSLLIQLRKRCLYYCLINIANIKIEFKLLLQNYTDAQTSQSIDTNSQGILRKRSMYESQCCCFFYFLSLISASVFTAHCHYSVLESYWVTATANRLPQIKSIQHSVVCCAIWNSIYWPTSLLKQSDRTENRYTSCSSVLFPVVFNCITVSTRSCGCRSMNQEWDLSFSSSFRLH